MLDGLGTAEKLTLEVRANFREFMLAQVKLASESDDSAASDNPVVMAWGIVALCWVSTSLQVLDMGRTLELLKTMVAFTGEANQSDRQNAPTSEAIQ